MKKTIYLFLVLLISLLGFSKISKASHYAAADLTYTCLGGNQYLITLTFFRDCSGVTAPTSADITMQSSCSNLTATLPLINGPTEVTPACPTASTTCSGGTLYGLEKYVYQGQVTLPPCSDWTFSWTDCCRNPSNTLLNSTGQNWYLPATLNNVAAPCNSSPYFSNMPATVICQGQSFCYNHGAIDPDGDSLVYSLVAPFQAAGTPVTYQGGYSALNPLPSSPPVSINPVTGDICMDATTTIIAVIGVRVEEWRRINGVATLIGTILRDMQVNVIACTNILPVLPGLNPLATSYNPNDSIYYHEMCLGETVYFDIYPFDANMPLQNLTLTWNNGIPGAFWLITNNGTPNAVGHFIWYPTPADVSNVPHCFTLNVADDNCPYIGQQTFSYCILVKTNQVILDPPGDSTLCLGESYQIVGHNTANMVHLNWFVDSVYTAPLNDTTFLVNADSLGPGTHVIACYDGAINNCPGSNRVTVTVNPNPSITATAQPPVICVGLTSLLTAHGAVNYFWNPGNLQGDSVVVAPLTTTTYTVIGTDSLGCVGTGTVTVNITTYNNISATANPSLICIGQSSVLTGHGGSSYNWQPVNLTGDSIIVSPISTAIYTVSGIDTLGCAGSAAVTVNVVAPFIVNAYAYPTLICAGDTSRLSVNGASNYIWQPDSIPGDSIDVIPTATTLYTVIGDVSGCLGSDTITVKVFPNPDIQITADIFEGCEDLPVHFTDLSNFPAVSWYWDFGDHMYSYYQNPGHIYPNPGVFDVSLTMASLYGCTSTYTWPDMINVYKQPHAYFTPIPAYVEELNPTVWFCDQSISATAWNWYFGDPVHQYNYSNLQNPNHTYSDTGSYTVTLAAISEHQCTDTFRYEINVTPSVAFYIPNSFSPNGDGKNETFQGKGIGINPDKFEMYVFTRWGEKIYASHDLNEAWDGRVRGKGKTSEEGIYTWMVIFTDILGKDHKITGYVALIR